MFMAGCTPGFYDEDDLPMADNIGSTPELNFDGETVIEADKYGGEYSISFSANLPWKVSSLVPWMEILGDNKGPGGEGMLKIKFLVSKNASLDPRQGKISVKITDEAVSYITVKQKEMTIEELCNDWYVKPGAKGDGSSWDKAMDLNTALQSCANGDIIHVAAGVYKPEILVAGTEVGNKTFFIGSNISVIGGYPADPKEGDLPDPSVNKSVLSGDGKAYHVLSVAALRDNHFTVNVSGLVITDGVGGPKAGSIALNGSRFYFSQGSGLSVLNSKANFVDCEITGNTATAGTAGAMIHESDATFTRCTFSNNTNNKNAPGIWSSAGNVVFDECVITGNITSNGIGGGIYCLDAANSKTPTNTYIYNSYIASNGNEASKSSRRGGGLYLREASNTVIVNTTITDNRAGNGGGVATYQVDGAPTSLVMISCTVTGNESTATGGGVEVGNGVTAKIYNTIISGNTDVSGASDLAVTGADSKVVAGKLPAALEYCVNGSSVYGAAAELTSASFAPSTMLGTLDGVVFPLVGEGNPALTMGMPVAELKNLVSGYDPEMDKEQLGRDQKGNTRSGAVMGAYVGN